MPDEEAFNRIDEIYLFEDSEVLETLKEVYRYHIAIGKTAIEAYREVLLVYLKMPKQSPLISPK